MKTNYVKAGNCVDLMQSLPEESVDLVITSPPYDNLRDYKGYTFQFEDIAAEINRIIKPGGVIVWIVGDATVNGSETGSSFRQALHFMDLRLRLHDTMIYRKKNPPPQNHKRYEQSFEYMFIFSKGKPVTFNPLKRESCQLMTGGTYRQKDGKLKAAYSRRISPPFVTEWNIWSYSVGKGSTATDNLWIDHPAVMPLKLARDHVISWSNPGDTVLDPMCGSGQVCVASMQEGRNYIGFDVSPEYVALSEKRIKLYCD